MMADPTITDSRKESSFSYTNEDGVQTTATVVAFPTAEDLMLQAMRSVAAGIASGADYVSVMDRGVVDDLVYADLPARRR